MPWQWLGQSLDVKLGQFNLKAQETLISYPNVSQKGTAALRTCVFFMQNISGLHFASHDTPFSIPLVDYSILRPSQICSSKLFPFFVETVQMTFVKAWSKDGRLSDAGSNTRQDGSLCRQLCSAVAEYAERAAGP